MGEASVAVHESARRGSVPPVAGHDSDGTGGVESMSSVAVEDALKVSPYAESCALAASCSSPSSVPFTVHWCEAVAPVASVPPAGVHVVAPPDVTVTPGGIVTPAVAAEPAMSAEVLVTVSV